MKTVKFAKLDSFTFISHIDMLRHMTRILRRAEIPVKRSNGFNPHALVFFSPPLVLGARSFAEYVSIDTDMPLEELLARFSASAPDGMKVIRGFEEDKNPNLQGKIVASDYVFDAPYSPINIEKFEISYQKKGETVNEDVSSKLFCAWEREGKLAMRLATGNTNLRPDRILSELNARLGASLRVTDIEKIAQYVEIEGKLVDVDEYLTTIEMI